MIDISRHVGVFRITSKRRKKFNSYEELPNIAILSIGYANRATWHWTVFQRTDNGNIKVFDPECGGKVIVGNQLNNLNTTHFLSVEMN